MTEIHVNGAFIGQRVTGQQRYAQEVWSRLNGRPQVRLVSPSPWLASTKGGAWLWTQGPAVRRRGAFLLSMTSRAPAWHRRQVMVAHDVFPLTHPEWYSRKYVATHAPLLRHQLQHARGVVAVSPATAEALEPWIPAATPVLVAPNGVSDDVGIPLEPDEVSEVLSRHGLSAGSYLLTVGSVDPRKNIERLVSAYSGLSVEERTEMPLVIVGGGSAGVFATEDQRAHHGLHRLGYVSDHDLAAIYGAARGFVLPSLDEGFGIPVIEAAAHGLPLLLSDIPVFRWIAGDAARYFDPTSVEDLREALALAIHVEVGAPVMALPAALRKRFDWQQSADLIEGFIRDQLSS